MTLEVINNVAIIGHVNPIVNCNDTGSVMFISCSNVTIEGVKWKGCGSVNNLEVMAYNTSNIVIQSYSFHHSTGKAVTLLNFQEMCP